MNLLYFNQLQILLQHRSMNSIKYTENTVNNILKLKQGWFYFDKPTLEEYIKYNTSDDCELLAEEEKELIDYYEYDFPYNKFYFHISWENSCLVINNKVIYTPFSNDEYEQDYSDLFEYLLSANIVEDLPFQYKFGIIKRKDLYDLIPEYRKNYLLNKYFRDKDLEEFINDDNLEPISLTKDSYLLACHICYLANKLEVDNNYINEYKRYADGRDDGLLDIENTEKAFKSWFKQNHYGHPYEIMRGGNSTHISLYPIEENDKFYLALQGKAWNRSIETLNAFVELRLLNYPVKLLNKDIILDRYYEKDYVGILPDYIPYSYYNNEFKELFDVNVEDSFSWNSFGIDIDLKKLLMYTQVKKEK